MHGCVKLAERGTGRTCAERARNVFLLLELAVVAQNAVQRLQGDVPPEKRVQDADAVNIVVKVKPCFFVQELRKKAFSGVTKRRVTNVVPERNCFY